MRGLAKVLYSAARRYLRRHACGVFILLGPGFFFAGVAESWATTVEGVLEGHDFFRCQTLHGSDVLFRTKENR